MAQGKPLDDALKAAILDDIRARRNSCRGIARDHGVSDATVRKIAKDNDISDAFSRENTEKATRARKADMLAERALVGHLFLKRAREALEQMDQPHTVFNFGGRDNTYNEHTLDRPPTGDMRNLMITAATAFDKHLVRERFDNGDNADQLGSLLGNLLDSLQARHGTDPE